MAYQKIIHTTENLDLACQKFAQDGIVFFNPLLPPDQLNSAEIKITEQISKATDTEKLVNLHLSDEWFAEFVSKPEFTSVASKLLDVPNVKIFSSMILNKPAHGLMTVPWHQDAAYDWPLRPIDCASLWLAFDDVTTANGAMKVVIGAHKDGAYEMQASDQLDSKDQFFSTQLQKSIPEKIFTDKEIIDVTMKKGFASFHHSMLPHASFPNHTPHRRCAFIVRYCRGDASLVKYPGMPREEYFKDFVLFEPTRD